MILGRLLGTQKPPSFATALMFGYLSAVCFTVMFSPIIVLVTLLFLLFS